MKGVRRHPVADHLGINPRPTLPCVPVLLKDENPGAFAHHETVAFPVPGTRGPRRVVIEPCRERSCRSKASQTQPANRRFGATAYHYIGIIEHDHPRRIADRMRPARAGRNHCMVWAGEAVTDRDMAGGKVDQIGRDEKRRQAAWPALVQGNAPSVIPGSPPIPEPIMTPVRSQASSLSGSQPASSTA